MLRPDVVLMDVRMGALDGIEATRRIVAAGAGRVVVLTTFDLDEYVYAALRAGAAGFLLKDAPREELVRAVRVADAGSQFRSRDVFPPATGAQLLSITKSFVRLTKALDPSSQTIENLRRTFRGLFAILHIGWSVVKGVVGVIGDLLGVVGKGGIALRLGQLHELDRVGQLTLDRPRCVDRFFQPAALAHDLLRGLGIVPQGGILNLRIQLVEPLQRAIPIEEAAQQRQGGIDLVDMGLRFGAHGISFR